MQIGRWLLFLAPALLAAQTVSIELSPLILESGRAIAVIQILVPPGSEPAALEWTVRLDSAAAHVQCEPGEQAIAAKKQITCSSSKGQAVCVLWGPNRNVIHNGIVAKVIVSNDGNGAADMRLTGVSAASKEGSGIAINVRPNASQIRKQRSVLFSLPLIGGGIALLLFAVFAAIYAARSRLPAVR